MSIKDGYILTNYLLQSSVNLIKALNRLKLPGCAKWLKSSQRKALIIFGDVY